MKTRRPKKSKKGKTIRKKIILAGGAQSVLEEIEENEVEVRKALTFLIAEKYDVNEFTTSNCAVAMIREYKEVVPLKNGTVKGEEDLLRRMRNTRNHLVDLYPDIPDADLGDAAAVSVVASDSNGNGNGDGEVSDGDGNSDGIGSSDVNSEGDGVGDVDVSVGDVDVSVGEGEGDGEGDGDGDGDGDDSSTDGDVKNYGAIYGDGRESWAINRGGDVHGDLNMGSSEESKLVGGVGYGFEKEIEYQQCMVYTRTFDGTNLLPRPSNLYNYVKLWKGELSNYTKEKTLAGTYQNSNRELYNITQYYLYLVSFLLFLDSKQTFEKDHSNLKALIDAVIEKSRNLIDEYAKINIMLYSTDNVSNVIVKGNFDIEGQIYIIEKSLEELSTTVDEINKDSKLNFLITKNKKLRKLVIYPLTELNKLHFPPYNIKKNVTVPTKAAIKAINKSTNKKRDLVKVFDKEVEGKRKQAEADRQINQKGEFTEETESLIKFTQDFSESPDQNVIVTQNDTILEIIKKLKTEYNNNSEFIIRTMHLLNRLGNSERTGKNEFNLEGLNNKLPFYNHPFNRYAKTYINGIRQLIEVLIDVHTKYQKKDPNKLSLKINELLEEIEILKSNKKKIGYIYPTNITLRLEEVNQYYWSIMNALRRFYKLGKDPGTIKGSIIPYSTLFTEYKTEFTKKFQDIINQKGIKMQNTNLENILTDMSNNILDKLEFNNFNNFTDEHSGKWRVVDFAKGMKSKTEYNKLATIWSDTSDSGLIKMEKYLREKNKFKMDEPDPNLTNINATTIRYILDKTEQKIKSMFKKKRGESEEQYYLQNVQNCFLIIDHYATKIKKMLSKLDITGLDIKKLSPTNNKWEMIEIINRGFDAESHEGKLPLTYLLMNNITKYFEKKKTSCDFLEKAGTKNIYKVCNHVSDMLLNKIVMSCVSSKISDHLNVEIVDRLTDDTVQKHLLSFVKNIDKPNRAEEPTISTAISRELSATLSVPAPALSYRRKHILFRLLTLANPEHLSDIFGDRPKTDAIITKMHKTVLKGGGFNETRNKNVFNIRTAYDNIFKNASSDTIKILVQSLFLKYPSIFVDVIKILGDPNPVLNEDAIRKMKEVVNEDVVDDKGTEDKVHRAKEKLNTELNDKKNRSALNYYTSVRIEEKKSVRIDEKENPPKENNDSPTETAQIKSVAKKAEHQVENEFREKINVFVLQKEFNDTDTQEEELKIIHKIYDDLAAIGNNRLKKNVANNLIDYAASVYFGRMIESELKEQYRPKAFERRDLFIDQFTRLNTKPNVDPFLERVISTFWPEADAINYKRPPSGIITKKTLIETKLYPTPPTVMLEADTNPSGDKPNQTYGRKIMTVTEKVDGDQSDYDALGVEMFLNTLLTTGSNVSVIPEAVYGEEYKLLEKVDNSAYISKEK